MTIYKKPQCYGCIHHTNAKCSIGKSPACKKYPNGRPAKVFYEGGSCAKFESKVKAAKPIKAKKSAKKKRK